MHYPDQALEQEKTATVYQGGYNATQYTTSKGYTIEQPVQQVTYTTSGAAQNISGGQQVVYTTGVPAASNVQYTTTAYQQVPATTTTTYVTNEQSAPVGSRYYSGTYPAGTTYTTTANGAYDTGAYQTATYPTGTYQTGTTTYDYTYGTSDPYLHQK